MCDCLLTKHQYSQKVDFSSKLQDGLQMKVSWHAFKLKLVEAVTQTKRFCGKPKRKKKNQTKK